MTICTALKKKKYPESLHQYKIKYKNKNERILYANGATHAYAISKENWPNEEIYDVEQLDDSWKNLT